MRIWLHQGSDLVLLLLGISYNRQVDLVNGVDWWQCCFHSKSQKHIEWNLEKRQHAQENRRARLDRIEINEGMCSLMRKMRESILRWLCHVQRLAREYLKWYHQVRIKRKSEERVYGWNSGRVGWPSLCRRYGCVE